MWFDEAIADETTHDDIKADHDAVVAKGGFGVPTLVFEGDRHVYGPVVVPAPTGEEALALWTSPSPTRRCLTCTR